MNEDKLGAQTWDEPTFAKWIKEHQRNENDLTVLITGRKGRGKSTSAHNLAKLIDKDYSFEKNMVISPDSMAIADAIERAGLNPAIVADEAIGNLYTENWADKAQKALHVYLNEFQRKEKYAVLFLCIPSVHDCRGPLRRSGIDIWIRLMYKGEGAVLFRSDFDEEDPFRIWELKYAQQKAESETGLKKTWQQYSPEYQRSVYSKLSSFVGFIKFNKMPDEDWKQYADFYKSKRAELKNKIFEQASSEKLLLEFRQLRVAEKQLKVKKLEEKDTFIKVNEEQMKNDIESPLPPITNLSKEEKEAELDKLRFKLASSRGKEYMDAMKRFRQLIEETHEQNKTVPSSQSRKPDASNERA